jgi:hypothetical protein
VVADGARPRPLVRLRVSRLRLAYAPACSWLRRKIYCFKRLANVHHLERARQLR